MGKRTIKKVKYSHERVEIEYEESPKEGEVNKFSISCAEPPGPGLDKALQSLKPEVLALCELPEEFGKGMTVTTVHLSEKDGNTGAVITVVKKLTKRANGVVVLNTPHVPTVAYDKGGRGPHLSTDAADAIEELRKEAFAYIKGKRAQTNLFQKPGGKDDK